MCIFRFLALTYIYCVVCFGIDSCVNTAKAEDSYKLYIIPKGQTLSCGNSTFQAFNLEEYKSLLRIDANYKRYKLKSDILTDEVNELYLNVANYKKLIKLRDNQLKLHIDEIVRKDNELEKITQTNLELHGKLELRKRLLRVGGGVVSALIGGLVLGLYLK